MCLRYCVLGFTAHSIISGDDSHYEDAGYDYDRYDFLVMAQTSRSVLISFSTRLMTLLFYAYLFRELCEDICFEVFMRYF